MKKLFVLVAAVLVASTLLTVAAFGREKSRSGRAEKVTKLRDLSLELVGQLVNSPPGVTPATHTHYGYLSYATGVTIFKGTPENETAALFTFYAEAATARVIIDGPLRVITRVGTVTIYRDLATNGDFANPETFRDGSPVLVATLRQQSILDTVSETFTTFHQNRITSTTPFPAGPGKVQLGVVGDRFTTVFRGHSNMPGPPSGYFAGYAISR
jgi:hypothetical protein